MGTLYARHERTTDSATADMFRNAPQRESVMEKWHTERCHQDVQLYYDSACTKKAGRIPWHYTKPTRRNKYQMLNCARYRLVWVEEKQ